MKTEKIINLTAYMVEYIDQREPKPRTVHTETVVLDGGKISALNRLDLRPAGYITQQFERSGYTVATIRKGETITAHVDLADLWQQTAAQVERDRLKIQLQAALEELNSQGGGGMKAPALLTAREAYDLIHGSEPLPGGTYAFCCDVLDLWGAKPVSKESETNLMFMLSSVFAAGMEYVRREGGAVNADWNV